MEAPRQKMQAPREFFAVAVKPGQQVKVGPKKSNDGYTHLSQVALGKANKSERVAIYLKVDNNEFVLGTLSNKFSSFLLDIVLEKESELFHHSKTAIVDVCGYKIFWDNPAVDVSHNSDNVDNENVVALKDKDTAKVKAAKGAKSGKTVFEIGESSKQVKIRKSSKQVKIIDLEKDEDGFYDVSSDEDDSDSFNPMDISDEESESYEVTVSDWDEEDEIISSKKKVGQKNRKANKSATKSSASSKKAKKATTKKADGKKGVRTATSRPKKKTVKISDILKNQAPDSRGEKPLDNIAKDQAPDSGGEKTLNVISSDQAPNLEEETTANNISKDQSPDFGVEEQAVDYGENRNYIDLNETYEEQLSG